MGAKKISPGVMASSFVSVRHAQLASVGLTSLPPQYPECIESLPSPDHSRDTLSNNVLEGVHLGQLIALPDEIHCSNMVYRVLGGQETKKLLVRMQRNRYEEHLTASSIGAITVGWETSTRGLNTALLAA